MDKNTKQLLIREIKKIILQKQDEIKQLQIKLKKVKHG